MGVIENLWNVAVVAARAVDLAAGFVIVGSLVVCLLASPVGTPTTPDWRWWLVRGNGIAAALLVASGVFVLATHPAAKTSGEAFEPQTWVRPLGDMRFGAMWLVGHGALLLTAALVPLGEWQRRRRGRVICRVGAIGLGAIGMGATALASHALSANRGPWPMAALGAAHAAGAAVWLGTLPWLVALLRTASGEDDVADQPRALLAVHRFSTVAVVAALGVAASGLWSARSLAGPVPHLVGTSYGRLLLVKLALLLPLVALAWRRAHLLRGRGPSLQRGFPIKRLARMTALETALGFAALIATGCLVITPPGAGESPVWPLSVRFAPEIMWNLPGVKMEVALGAEILLLAVLAFVGSHLAKRWRPLLLAVAMILLIIGLAKALMPMTVDAYPTTYLRPSVPYTAESVAHGRVLFAAHCATCHGPMGRGDGPAAASLLQIPADLTAPHTNDHTAGDMFWWVTNGLGLVMPAFGDRLSVPDRWDLINFVRALSAGEQARGLTATLEPGRPRVGAPDFSYSTNAERRRLKDHRGRQSVLLVLFTLPSSRSRLDQLARAHDELVAAGAGIVTVPIAGEHDTAGRLGPAAPSPAPVVTDGRSAIAATYALFGTPTPAVPAGEAPLPTHMEFLIDRSGYLRARWIPENPQAGWGNVQVLLAELRTLSRERAADPPDGVVR